MLEMTYISFAFFLGLSAHIVFIMLCYFKHEGVCLDWTRAHKSFFITHPLYEYILVENNKIVTHCHSGTTLFYPKKGKKYKILIRKTDHTKVIGYGGVVLEIIWALFYLLYIVWDVYFYLT